MNNKYYQIKEFTYNKNKYQTTFGNIYNYCYDKINKIQTKFNSINSFCYDKINNVLYTCDFNCSFLNIIHLDNFKMDKNKIINNNNENFKALEIYYNSENEVILYASTYSNIYIYKVISLNNIVLSKIENSISPQIVYLKIKENKLFCYSLFNFIKIYKINHKNGSITFLKFTTIKFCSYL